MAFHQLRLFDQAILKYNKGLQINPNAFKKADAIKLTEEKMRIMLSKFIRNYGFTNSDLQKKH